MRLIYDDGHGNLSLIEREDNNIPRYAVLSHTWGADGEEVTFKEFMEGTGKNKAGYDKIEFCRKQAAGDDIQFFWVDTCCIDKSSSAELTEAVNSMFRWYQKAAKCYVYLTDVSSSGHATNTQSSPTTWKVAFRGSRWFRRGWTLQELIAPVSVEFFSREGDQLGSKTLLEQDIRDITGIPIAALRGKPLVDFKVKERMSWAEHRETKRQEDKAYSLLGIFDVHIPLIYGEGREKAFMRLREEIEKTSKRERDSYEENTPFPGSLEGSWSKGRRIIEIHEHSLRGKLSHDVSSRSSEDEDFIAPQVPEPCHSDHRAEHAVRPSHYLPFPRNRRFVGRDAELKALTQKLLMMNECQRLALVGLGGVGKTQIALEFAYTVKATRPEFSIFWVAALSAESFRQGCAEIARRLHINQAADDKQDVKELVRQYLSAESAGRWLLIVDNADDTDVLFGSGGSSGIIDFLPDSEDGLIVFTTRYQEAAVALASSDVIELEEMSRQEAVDFLEKSLIRKDMLTNDAIATKLLSELTYLPLAIAQAAAYLNTNRISIAQYLGLLRNTEQDIISVMSREFRDSTRYQGSKNAVATTWLVTFDQILRSNPTAADLLAFMSCIEAKVIPRSILPAVQPEERMVAAIGMLSGYAFVIRQGNEEIYDLHRLVHLATRIWIERNGLAADVIIKAIQHVAEAFPSHDYEKRDLWRQYLPHALKVLQSKHGEDSEERYDLCAKVGRCLRADGRVGEAVRWFEEAFRWRQDNLSREHPVRLAAQRTLASAYRANGQIGQAVELLEHIVAVEEKVRVEEHPSRLKSQHELARAYSADKQVDKAIKLLEHVVAVSNKVLVEENLDRLASQAVLASAYRSNGQMGQAVELLEHVLAVQEKLLVEEHPDRLTSQHELASAYSANRQVDKGIKLLEHVVAVQEKVLVEKHPSRLTSQHELAVAYLRNGQTKKAVELLEHVVAVREKVQAQEHPHRLTSQHALATAYRANGQVVKAFELLEHIVAIESKVLRDDHPLRLASQNALAKLRAELEANDEAST